MEYTAHDMKMPHSMKSTTASLCSIVRLLGLTICCGLSLLIQPTNAEDDLTEIEQELHIGDSNSTKKNIRRIYTAKWFEPGSNYAKVFISHEGPKLLAEWVGAKALGYKINKVVELREEDYAGIRIALSHKATKIPLRLTILVPHPRSHEARELGVISAISAFEPPAFLPTETLKVSAGGLKGTAYFKKDEISMLFHLPRGSVLNLAVDRKFGLAAIQMYANNLNFERLMSKLES